MKILSTFPLLFICVFSAQAATFTVTRSDDRGNPTCVVGDCSLREAATAASAGGPHTINFASNVSTITLTGEISVNPAGVVTINGRGANIFTVNGGAGTNRVFALNGSITITGMTITGGNGNGGNPGGGIAVGGGTVTISNSVVSGNSTVGTGGGIHTLSANLILNGVTISGNTGADGGGIQHEGGTLTISNSTFSGNRATDVNGGGGLRAAGSTVTIRNSTFTLNSTAGNGGGIQRVVGTVNVGNTIIAGNIDTSTNNAPDIQGAFTTAGNNLIGNSAGGTGFTNGVSGDKVGVSPLLGALYLNGGTTRTHALLAGSPAIDAGSNTLASTASLTTDQRGVGFPRTIDGDGNASVIVDMGAYERNPALLGQRRVDFDGDEKTDLSIFRPTPGEWWFYRSSDGGNRAFAFGNSTDKLVPGDFTDDGKTDIAFWRPSTGFWFVLRSEDSSFFSFPFGLSTDLVAPGDYDGDGKTDAAVFRPSSATWFIRRSSDAGTAQQQFGASSDIPVPADYDGDGKADIAIFRPSSGQWWWQRSSDSQVFALTFGVSTDKPVQGDYTGDGKDDIALFRPSTREWFVLRSEDFSFFSVQFGIVGDLPVPGDYDGDGKFDVAVFRPSNSTWFVTKSTGGTIIQTFGTAGDRPVPNAFVP